jgi:hypothetical protein
LPPAAGDEHIEDAFDGPAIVCAGATGASQGWEKRLDEGPLTVREMNSSHAAMLIHRATVLKPPLAVLAYWVGPYRENAAILEHFRGIPAFDQMLLRAGLRLTLTKRDPGQATNLEQYEKAARIIEMFVISHS